MMKSNQQRECRKRCSTCLWCWPDIHDANNPKRVCYNEGSPFYSRERAPMVSACEAHESKANITHNYKTGGDTACRTTNSGN